MTDEKRWNERLWLCTVPRKSLLWLWSHLWLWCSHTQRPRGSPGAQGFPMETDVCAGAANVGMSLQVKGVKTESSTSAYRADHCVPSVLISSISAAILLWLQLLTLSHKFSCSFPTLVLQTRTKRCVSFSNAVNCPNSPPSSLGKQELQINNEAFFIIKNALHLWLILLGIFPLTLLSFIAG